MSEGLFTPSHVANYFLSQPDHKIDNLKLNKLVYISYGWNLTFDRKLFNDPIEAWKYGPVIPSLYHEFKRFGVDIIDGLSYIEPDNAPKIGSEYTDVLALMKSTYENYGIKYSAINLVELTHGVGGPWEECFKSSNWKENIIKDEIRKKHYKRLLDDYRKSLVKK